MTWTGFIWLRAGTSGWLASHVKTVMNFGVPYKADDILTHLQSECECECARVLIMGSLEKCSTTNDVFVPYLLHSTVSVQ
jgi:hypothetical protein